MEIKSNRFKDPNNLHDTKVLVYILMRGCEREVGPHSEVKLQLLISRGLQRAKMNFVHMKMQKDSEVSGREELPLHYHYNNVKTMTFS